MEMKEWTTIDRSGWPQGPWDGEPDKVQWPDEKTGLPCLAVRQNNLGHWCGYVGVAEGHPAFQKDYDDVLIGDEWPSVHGGLTFAGLCRPHGDDHSKGICHIPGPGEPDKVWWLGFDCAHAGDYGPYDAKRAEAGGIWALIPDDQYRTLSYVKGECAALATQLASAVAPSQA